MKKIIFTNLLVLTICSLFIVSIPSNISAIPVDDAGNPESVCAQYSGNTTAYQACLDNAEAAAQSANNNNTAPARGCTTNFLGFPAWYDGLIDETTCDVKIPSGDEAGLSKFIWRLALNILQIAMVGAAYVTTYFIMYGGFKYLTSRGSPDGIAKGKASIINAVLGLIIVMAAIGVVNVIINGLGL